MNAHDFSELTLYCQQPGEPSPPPLEFMGALPDNRKEFLARVKEIGETTNLPDIWGDHQSDGDLNRVEIKDLLSFATMNNFGHYGQMSDDFLSREEPGWVGALREIMSMPGADVIDPYLALSIALRESGGHNYERKYTKKGKMINSYHDSGLDHLYSYKQDLQGQGFVPTEWFQSKVFVDAAETHVNSKGERYEIHAAEIPGERLLAFTFAMVGRAHENAVEALAGQYFGSKSVARSQLMAAPPLAQRVWVALAFAAPWGNTTGLGDKATTSPGNAGVRSYARAFGLLELELAQLSDIRSAVSSVDATKLEAQEKDALKFLRRVDTFDRFNIATKTAVVATALEEMTAENLAARDAPKSK